MRFFCKLRDGPNNDGFCVPDPLSDDLTMLEDMIAETLEVPAGGIVSLVVKKKNCDPAFIRIKRKNMNILKEDDILQYEPPIPAAVHINNHARQEQAPREIRRANRPAAIAEPAGLAAGYAAVPAPEQPQGGDQIISTEDSSLSASMSSNRPTGTRRTGPDCGVNQITPPKAKNQKRAKPAKRKEREVPPQQARTRNNAKTKKIKNQKHKQPSLVQPPAAQVSKTRHIASPMASTPARRSTSGVTYFVKEKGILSPVVLAEDLHKGQTRIHVKRSGYNSKQECKMIPTKQLLKSSRELAAEYEASSQWKLPYVPTTALAQIHKLKKQEGRLVIQPRYSRLVYFAKNNETVQKIGNKFKVDARKVLNDNKDTYPRLSKHSKLEKETAIVLPICYGDLNIWKTASETWLSKKVGTK